MKKLIAALENVDTRLLVLAALLFFAVCFAILKASGAINGSINQPAYQNIPAQAFVPPASVTLVDPTDLTAPRLPDQDYIAVVAPSRALSGAVAELTVTAAQLQAAGMSASATSSTIVALNTEGAGLQGRQADVAAQMEVTPGSNFNTAVVTANVEYSGTPNGAPAVGASESFSYAEIGSSHHWQLQNVALDVAASG